ncbi:hypothetical protein AURDEDRAFT_161030 [Auricularia subglabra TFB-10046 SS5]|nr:hypothetical protein AURDEDRAFT_161030 [Auricularia subglabra TFB-10046 SS5]
MNYQTDSHYRQMLLGLMESRPHRRVGPCDPCGGDTRQAVWLQEHPVSDDFSNVGRWISTCVLCKSPVQYLSPPLSSDDLDLVKTYYDLRQKFISTGASEAHKRWEDRDANDVDLGIRVELYNWTEKKPLRSTLRTCGFPEVSLWDCPAIKRQYEHDKKARFQVFNPVKSCWQNPGYVAHLTVRDSEQRSLWRDRNSLKPRSDLVPN